VQAVAYYGVQHQRWPAPYESGQEQFYRLAPRDRANEVVVRRSAKPPSHRRV